jgi:hypothetical protein
VTVRLSIAVEHHPSRADLLNRSAHLNPDIVVDPEPDGIRNSWRTYRYALETTPDGCTHRLVVQDDAQFCTGFREQAEAAIAAKPDALVVFFVSTALRRTSRNMLQACARGEHWVQISPGGGELWVPVVATSWPAVIIPDFLAWCDRRGYTKQRFRADDAIVGRYVNEQRIPCWATVPSLVEHPDDVVSIAGTRRASQRIPRHATCFWDEVTPLEWARG